LPEFQDQGPTEWGNLWIVASFKPVYLWSQIALQPSTNSFKVSADVATNNSSAGILFYAQTSTGTGVNHGGGAPSYPSARGFRALLENGTVVLHNCSDLNYLDNPSSVCTTIGSGTSVPTTGTLSVETNASTGSVKVYVNGTLKITASVNTGLMSGAVGMTSKGYYDYDTNGYPTTYHTATLDNFILERN
jgi:hypothetical protein